MRDIEGPYIDEEDEEEYEGRFIELLGSRGIRDPKDRGSDFPNIVQSYRFDEVFYTELFTRYRKHADLEKGWVPSEEERLEILKGIMVYRNSGPDGGFIFDMPVEQEDGAMDVLSFITPEMVVAPYRVQ